MWFGWLISLLGSCWCCGNWAGRRSSVSSQWKERGITFVSGTADIRGRRAPRIIHRGPRPKMESRKKACDRGIISTSLPPLRPHAVWASYHHHPSFPSPPPFSFYLPSSSPSLHLYCQSHYRLPLPDVSSSPPQRSGEGGSKGGGGGWGG